MVGSDCGNGCWCRISKLTEAHWPLCELLFGAPPIVVAFGGGEADAINFW